MKGYPGPIGAGRGLDLGLGAGVVGAVAGLVAQGLAPVAPDQCCRGTRGLHWGLCLSLGLGMRSEERRVGKEC